MQSPGLNPSVMPSNQKFGWLFTAIFTFGFIYFLRQPFIWLAYTSAVLSILFALLTILIPSALAPLNRAWLTLGVMLGRVVSPIILSIIFFALITPIALFTRAFGRDALLIKKRQVSSYWLDKEPIEQDSFKNQF